MSLLFLTAQRDQVSANTAFNRVYERADGVRAAGARGPPTPRLQHLTPVSPTPLTLPQSLTRAHLCRAPARRKVTVRGGFFLPRAFLGHSSQSSDCARGAPVRSHSTAAAPPRARQLPHPRARQLRAIIGSRGGARVAQLTVLIPRSCSPISVRGLVGTISIN